MLVLLAKVTAVFVVLTTTLSGCSPGCEIEEAKRCATSGENAVRLWYPKVSTSPTAKTILCRSVQEYYTCMKTSNCCYQDDEFKETHENTQEKMFFVEEVGVSFNDKGRCYVHRSKCNHRCLRVGTSYRFPMNSGDCFWALVGCHARSHESH